MNALQRTSSGLGLATLLAALPAYSATLSGTVQTADGDPIAATVSVLRSSRGVFLETHATDEHGSFSIEAGSGAIAVAAKAANHASQEFDLSDGIPSRVSSTLHPLRYFRGTLRDARGRTVAGASVRVRNLGTERIIRVDSNSTAVTGGNGEFTIAIPDGGSDRFMADIEADGWIPQPS
ncbi:MAG: hypothetical protein OXC19_25330 [Bryobacterales bacterium]|nr:hypothetical protein [Bryobacterales bacterium]